MIKLRICVPDQPDSIVSVEGDELTIGRNPECDAVISEAYVSAWHAKLVCGLAVADINSTNGVWVDGERITGTSLMQGSSFQLGPSSQISPRIEILEARGALQVDPDAMLALELENQSLRARVLELELELDGREDPDLEGSGTLMMPIPGGKQAASTKKRTPTPAPPLAEQVDVKLREESSKPMPASLQRSAQPRAASGEHAGLLEMIEGLVRDDVGEQAPVVDGPVEEFFTLESFRLLRQVEKVITRMAREFNQLYDMNTMLPDTGGNFRSFAAEILMHPDDLQKRQKMVEYLEDIRRWLGVTLAANRSAAQRLISEIKRDLSPEQLTSKQAVPLWRKLSGGQGMELWGRVQAYLKKLDEERVEDRLDALAKEFAIGIMDPK